MRTDAEKNLAKVAIELVKDPLQTARELAENAGIGASTANRARKELAQNGTIDRNSRTIKIAETDLDIVDSIQRITMVSLDEIEAKVSQGKPLTAQEINLLASTAEKSQKRQAFLDGDNVNEKGGERGVSEEQRQMATDLLSRFLNG